MISWLLIIILAYFFFSLTALADKVFLAGAPKPISYTFYVGLSGIFTAALIPFINFSLPSPATMFWIVAEAIVFILGLYIAYTAVEKYDISKVVTTIGAMQPLFVLVLTYLFFDVVITNKNIVAFALLLIGSVLVSKEGKSIKSFLYIALTAGAAMLFSLDYIFSKMVFLSGPFLNGFNTKLWPGEDPEFFSRAKENGFKIAYSPDLIIYHRRRNDLSSLLNQHYKYGNVRLKKKWIYTNESPGRSFGFAILIK